MKITPRFAVISFLLFAMPAKGKAAPNPYPNPQFAIPSEPGQPFWLNSQLGGIPDSEHQIPYKQYPARDWDSRPLGLPELIDEALRRHPATHQTWETANAFAHTVVAAKSSYWPTITFTGAGKPGYSRKDDFSKSRSAGETRTWETDYLPTLQVQYLLLDFGGRKAGVDAARFSFFAAGFAVNQSLQAVVIQVLKSYYALQQAKEAVVITRDTWCLADEITKIIDSDKQGVARESEGLLQSEKEFQYQDSAALKSLKDRLPALGNELSVLSQQERQKGIAALIQENEKAVTVLDAAASFTRPNLTVARFNYAAAAGAVEVAKAQLATSLGLPGTTEVKVRPPPLSPPEVGFVGHALERIIQIALRNRPDIAIKFASYNAAKASARQAESNIYPNITVNMTGSTTEANRRLKVDDPSNFTETHTVGHSDSLGSALTVNIPIFDGFNLISKARAARRNAAAAQADLANTELNAISDVTIAFASYTWAVRQWDEAKTLEETARVANDNARKGYTDAFKEYRMSPPNSPESKLHRETLLTNINALLRTQPDLDSAKKTASLAKLNVFISSFQLASAAGVLLPAVSRNEEPSVLSIPLHKESPQPLLLPNCSP